MNNEQILLPYFNEFYDKINNEDFVILKDGTKTVEIIIPRIELDPSQPMLDFGVRRTPQEYVEAELQWYDSQDLSVDFIKQYGSIWGKVAADDGTVCSNYGWCIYSDDNYNQYNNCLHQLISDKSSRRACMIYTRPSIQVEYNKDGRSDFICTFDTQQFIRNNMLVYVVMMRSNDVVYGFFNDFAWHCEVYKRLFTDLKSKYPELQYGTILWTAGSFHVYERHFDLIKQIVESNKGG